MPKPPKLCTRAVEFRAASEGDGHTLEGYAAVFNTPTRIDSWEGTFDERISKGAFAKTIGERTPILQYDHGHDSRMGSTPIGSISSLTEDRQGLHVTARLFDNPVVEPIRQAVEGGAITGMSFRFKVVRDEWRDKDRKLIKPDELGQVLYNSGDRGPISRTIREVELFELGPVAFPAYAETSVGVRSAEVSEADRAELLKEYVRTAVSEEEERVAPVAKVDPTKQSPDSPVQPVMADDETVNDHDADDPYASKQGPEGDINYADPGYLQDGIPRYPLTTAAECNIALQTVDDPDQVGDYTSDQINTVKANIAGALAKFDEMDLDAKADNLLTSEVRAPNDAAPSGTSSGHGEEQKSETPTPVRERIVPKFETRKESVPMKTIAEMRARLAEISTRMGEIDAEAPEAALSEERQTEWDGLETEVTSLQAAVKGAEGRAARLKELAVNSPAHTERGSDQGTPAFHRKPDNIFDLDEVRTASNGQEDYVRRLRDNAMRCVETAKLPTVANRERAQESMEACLDKDNEAGELATRFLLTGSPEYERAFGKTMKALSTAGLTNDEQRLMQRAATLGTDSSGGFAVPVHLDPSVILTNAGTINPLRQIARVETLVGKEWQGVSSAGITVSRSAEAAEAVDGTPTLAAPVVRVTRVAGFVPFSVEIDMDWGSMRSEMTRLLADAKEREEADAFINGDGTGANPSGVVATLSGNTVTAGGTATFAASDLYNLENALGPRYRPNASFLANKLYWNKVRQFDTAGGAQLWERIGAGMPSQLLGYNAYEAYQMSSVTPLATSAKAVLFGDFSNFLIVDRIGMTVELVPHLFGATNRFPTGQRGIYAVWRNSSKILNHAGFKLLVLG